MRFMCLAYEDEAIFHEMDPDAWTELRQETLDYVESLRERGHLVLALPLRSATSAATVRVRGGDEMVTDGPFAETKEQLGGVFVVEARDRDEAVRLAAAWPSARLGTIEVRPVEEGLRADARYP